MDDYLTMDQLCKRLGFKKRYVYLLTHEERIPFIKIGGHLRFKWTSICTWLDSQEREPSRDWKILSRKGN